MAGRGGALLWEQNKTQLFPPGSPHTPPLPVPAVNLRVGGGEPMCRQLRSPGGAPSGHWKPEVEGSRLLPAHTVEGEFPAPQLSMGSSRC